MEQSATEQLPLIQECRDLGRSLRMWRALHRAKQTHVAEMLGVSQATVSRIEAGGQALSDREQRALRELLSARLTSAADRELARLTSGSSAATHLVCDFTHRLLALSPEREREVRIATADLLGRSLWACASEDMVALEATLQDRGWFEPAPPAITASTRARRGRLMRIPAGRYRMVRFRLSDGGFARFVETLTPPAAETALV